MDKPIGAATYGRRHGDCNGDEEISPRRVNDKNSEDAPLSCRSSLKMSARNNIKPQPQPTRNSNPDPPLDKTVDLYPLTSSPSKQIISRKDTSAITVSSSTTASPNRTTTLTVETDVLADISPVNCGGTKLADLSPQGSLSSESTDDSIGFCSLKSTISNRNSRRGYFPDIPARDSAPAAAPVPMITSTSTERYQRSGSGLKFVRIQNPSPAQAVVSRNPSDLLKHPHLTSGGIQKITSTTIPTKTRIRSPPVPGSVPAAVATKPSHRQVYTMKNTHRISGRTSSAMSPG